MQILKCRLQNYEPTGVRGWIWVKEMIQIYKKKSTKKERKGVAAYFSSKIHFNNQVPILYISISEYVVYQPRYVPQSRELNILDLSELKPQTLFPSRQKRKKECTFGIIETYYTSLQRKSM